MVDRELPTRSEKNWSVLRRRATAIVDGRDSRCLVPCVKIHGYGTVKVIFRPSLIHSPEFGEEGHLVTEG